MNRATARVLFLALAATAASAQTQPPSEVPLKALAWRNVGPFHGGRATTAVGVPGSPKTYYMGATGGGVWKTDDAGQSWRNISDGFFGTGSIGDIGVYAADSKVLYVGTGEAPVRGQMSSTGDGVYKSADAGKTWIHVGLEKTLQISRVVIHPSNPNLVYIAAQGDRWAPSEDRGIYRTTDGGATWERILFSSNLAGASDLQMDPRDPKVLYAAFWDHQRFPWAIRSGGPGSGIWRTTDGGDHWTQLTTGLPKTMGKIRLAVSPANPDRVYAGVECETSGLFRSDDSGKTWQQVNHQGGLATRPFYYMGVAADPKNPDIVYFSGASLLKSTDGGKTFSEIKTRHLDTHTLWINPSDPQNLVDTDDGGTEISFDGGASWSPVENQPIAQFYAAQTDDLFPYHIYGGQQDWGALAVSSRRPPGFDPTNWKLVDGDESARFGFDPKNPRVIFTGNYQGILHRTDTQTGFSSDVSAWPGQKVGIDAAEMTYRFNWSAPVATSPFDPDVIYHGANVLFRTRDQGQTWTAISPDLTRNDKSHQGRSGLWWHDGSGGEIYNTIFCVVESPHERGTIWIGTDDGMVQLTRDDGRTWTNVTPKDWAEGWVYNLEVSPHDKATAYVALSRHRTGDPMPHFYRTTDYGKTWTDLATTLPRNYPARVVREDPKRKRLLYAATENGVWVSFDAGEHWQSLQQNLPHVPVSDLTIRGDDLIVATEGRGFWILDDVSALREITPEVARADLHLFAPRATFRIPAAPVGPPGSDSAPGANPPAGVIVRYSLARSLRPDERLRLEIVDSQGEVVRAYNSAATPAPEPAAKPAEPAAKTTEDTQTTTAKNETPNRAQPGNFGQQAAPRPVFLTTNPGLNQMVWDLRGAPLAGTTGNGPLMPSGHYTLRMTLGMTPQISQPVEIVDDPRTTNMPAIEQERLALTRHLMQVLADTGSAQKDLQGVLKQARDLEIRAKSAPANVRDGVASFTAQLDSLDRRFQPYRPDPKATAGDQTALNVGVGPIALLAPLQTAIDTGNGPVTQGDRLRAKELETDCIQLRTHAEVAMDVGIAKVNALAASAGITPGISRHAAAAPAPGGAPLGPATAIRHGEALVRGKIIPYSVETGETIMRNAAGAPRATMFSVSYIASRPSARRPVTFIFNGGPGGATWPLREAISPKMIVPAEAAHGFKFANNPDSLIDSSDLVFIDAPGTGYSRFFSEDAKPEFWGIELDGRVFTEFIVDWLESHKRRASPVFILGESYGGTRTAQILKTLASQPEPLRVRGVVLVSPTLGTGAADVAAGGASRAVAILPSEAAVARFHGRGQYVSQPVEEVARAAEAFATGPYATALAQGERISAEEKRRIAEQVSGFIGIPTNTALEANLMVPIARFRDLLLADKGERVGSDGREHSPKPQPGQPESVITTAKGYDLQAAIVSLLRDELGYQAVGPYSRDPIPANRAWDNTITSHPSALVDVLKAAAAANPHFSVFLGGSYFDLIVPYFLSQNTLASAGLPHFVHHVYPSEHAFLNDPKNRGQATDDIRDFYRNAAVR